MNTTLKMGLLVASIGMAFASSQANAVVATHEFDSNPVNHCQNFVPGAGSQLRNRVVGIENTGPATAVACNFGSMYNGAATSLPPLSLQMWFANNNTTGTITVTCTLLTGYQGDPSQYASTKTTTTIAAGGVAQSALTWTAADNPTAGAANLGNYFVGVNCTLPTGAVMNDTYLAWRQDNGI